MANKRRSAKQAQKNQQQTAEHDATGGIDTSGEVASVVPQSPRSPDETTSDDAVTTNPAVSEERTPSTASGLPADDPDSQDERRKAYERGAILVSKI